jgi:CheY-like chemotaxis protein
MAIDPRATLTILVVDDDDVAAESLRRNLARLGVVYPIVTFADGQAALDALRGLPMQPAVPRPRVVLLDLNMPGMDGFAFLQQLRNDPELGREVVFVLTTSDDEADRARAYHGRIAGYIVKRFGGLHYPHLANLLVSFQSIVQLP